MEKATGSRGSTVDPKLELERLDLDCTLRSRTSAFAKVTSSLHHLAVVSEGVDERNSPPLASLPRPRGY